MAAATGPSAASRVFIAFLAAVVAIAALLGVILAIEAQAAERAEAETLTALARPHDRGGSRRRRGDGRDGCRRH